MELIPIPSIISGLFCAGLALFVLFRNPRSVAHQAFALGMSSLAVREAGSAFALLGAPGLDPIQWLKVSLIGEALLPGSWFLFSLAFARSNFRETLIKWRPLIAAAFGIPLLLVSLGWPNLLNVSISSIGSAESVIRLGPAGYYLNLLMLICFILALTQLEGTYRASSGGKRGQIKFLILGSGGILAFGVFDAGQTLLYSAIQLNALLYRPLVIILADLVIVFALVRHQLLDVDIFVSRYVIYSSVTLLASGIYLFLVGLIVFGVQRLGGGWIVPFIPALIFASLLLLAAFLMSEQVRLKAKVFINTHFFRNKYDYRVKWMEFTQSVGTKLTMTELSSSVVSWVAATLETSSVALWLYDPGRGRYELGGQTGYPSVSGSLAEKSKLIEFLRDQSFPASTESVKEGQKWGEVARETPEFFGNGLPAVFLPLVSGDIMSGFVILGKKITRYPYDFHDLELLKTVGDQIAGQIDRVRLTEDLAKAKEMEAFQTVSAFFIHDLKNLSSMLSLVVQNLPANIDNPEFRKDAFRIVSESVGKMNQISGNLSLVTKNLVLNRTDTDLNQLVSSVLTTLRHSVQVPLITNLQPLPPLSIDQKEIEKVLVNLVLNANEAIKENGEIQITTGSMDRFVFLSVKDNGSGMTPEYISKSLFLPFRTTKSKGLGIGLFQCKKIIEAHQGQIEVESEVGKGSEFRVLLPIGQGTGDRG